MNKELASHEQELKNIKQQKQNVNKKRQAKEEMKNKTESIQTKINKTTKDILAFRKQLSKLRTKLERVEEKKLDEIKEKNESIRQSRIRIREQMFFIQNLVPRSFIETFKTTAEGAETQGGKNTSNFRALAGVSVNDLHKPLSTHHYQVRDSYLCPYKNDFKMKTGNIGFIQIDDLLKDGKQLFLLFFVYLYFF